MQSPTQIVLKLLDRIVRPISIANLPMGLVVSQAIVLVACISNPFLPARLMLNWQLVLQGEPWRLFTFMFVGPVAPSIFAIFYFFLLHLMGRYLELAWGTVRFCTFVYLGLFLQAIAAYFMPGGGFVSGTYIYATIFLAFATLNPNFILQVMFILPVKVKYLAWLQGFGYAYAFATGDASTKVMVAASVGNYLLFFGESLYRRGTNFQRRRAWQAKVVDDSQKPRHVCVVCGIDSNTNRNIDFRYCSKCAGTPAYCEEHLRNHECIVEEATDTV